MKVTVDIDCTPLEARQFFGLPDVQPMQAAVLAEMERRTLAEMEKFSPENLLQHLVLHRPAGRGHVRKDALGGADEGDTTARRANDPPRAPCAARARRPPRPSPPPGRRWPPSMAWSPPHNGWRAKSASRS